MINIEQWTRDLKKGDQVKLTDLYLLMSTDNPKYGYKKDWIGTVIKFSDYLVWVKWGHLKTIQKYSRAFIKKIEHEENRH
jgi:hypothetical protein